MRTLPADLYGNFPGNLQKLIFFSKVDIGAKVLECAQTGGTYENGGISECPRLDCQV
jgi:hypothetical protein